MLQHVRTPTLDIACDITGPESGPPVVLLHGFPYDIHCYDEVAPPLAEAGARVIVPYLRGFGPTRFLSEATPRSGQQAALGNDLHDLLDALAIPRATVAGYDWGGRAACVVAALWPERVHALVTCNGYNIQDIAAAGRPAAPDHERRLWYQYYLHGDRGVAGLTAHRAEFCRLLWSLWSPTWHFDDATFARTAASFDNPDFVAVVVQSYRHRYALAHGDPALEAIERQLAGAPMITVPTIDLDGIDNGVHPPSDKDASAHFSGGYRRQMLPGVGHNVPQEAPDVFATAVRALMG